MNPEKTLGVYDFFPNIYHYAARFEFNASLSEFQEAILNALYNLNRLVNHAVRKHLRSVAEPNLEVLFEVGIADGLEFDYINEETLKVIVDKVKKQPPRTLDFICIIRYYRLRGKARRALRFDYYLMRLIFSDKMFEVQVFHERGLQRVEMEDLINILTEKINLEFAKRGISPIKVKSIWSIYA